MAGPSDTVGVPCREGEEGEAGKLHAAGWEKPAWCGVLGNLGLCSPYPVEEPF